MPTNQTRKDPEFAYSLARQMIEAGDGPVDTVATLLAVNLTIIASCVKPEHFDEATDDLAVAMKTGLAKVRLMVAPPQGNG